MEPPRALRRPNVLAVDDARPNLLALEAVLGGEYELVFASSGAEAIEVLRARDDIDVVLMDVQMPELDGFETAARMKQLPGRADVPIVFITAVYSEDPFVKRGYEVGGIDYFSKPFDPAILRLKMAVYASFRLKADLLREREERIREAEELQRISASLAAALDGQHVGVLCTDSHGNIQHMSDEATDILSGSDRHPRPKGLRDWLNSVENSLRAEGGPLVRALRLGESTRATRLDIECFDRSQKTILCSGSPLRDLNGETVGVVLLLHDVAAGRLIETDREQKPARHPSPPMTPRAE